MSETSRAVEAHCFAVFDIDFVPLADGAFCDHIQVWAEVVLPSVSSTLDAATAAAQHRIRAAAAAASSAIMVHELCATGVATHADSGTSVRWQAIMATTK